MTVIPPGFHPASSPPGAAPVMGYAGRRVQVVRRHLSSPRAAAPFLDPAHVLDHWAAMPPDIDHPTADRVFDSARDKLLAAVAASHEVFLSAGGGLLAYRCRSPQRWQVRHAESGLPVTRFTDLELPHRWWSRLSADTGLDFTPRSARTYVRALEGLADPRGTQIDWTRPADAVYTALARWQDHDEHGALPDPGTGNRFGGMSGLHLATVLHTIAADGRAARSVGVSAQRSAANSIAGLRVAGLSGQMTVRDRHASELANHLWRLDTDYNHGRFQSRRDRDWRTRQDLRDDRATGQIVTLARLLTFGGQPHQAVALLRERADAIAHTDVRRRDGLNSSTLQLAARMIADLFSPAVLPVERLHRIQRGQLIVEADRREPANEPVRQAWRVTQGAHHEWTGTDGRNFDIEVHDEVDDRPATLKVRPGTSNPIRVTYAGSRLSWSLPTLGGDWVVLEHDHPGLPPHGDVLTRAARAADTFEQDTASPTSPRGE